MKRPKKILIVTSEEPGAETGCWEQKEVLHMAPALSTTNGVGKPPKPPLQPNPWAHGCPHPIYGTRSSPCTPALGASQASKGNCVFLVPLLGEGNGTPLQYSCLENPTDGGAW